VRLFNVDGPSPWTYFFVCLPELLGTARVQAFREWIFAEAEQFRLLYERTPAVCDAPAGNLRALP